MSASATARRAGGAGMVEGLAIIKRRISEGFVVKSLTIEIVTWTAGCFAHSPGAFLLMC